jgi:hypothetical protein
MKLIVNWLIKLGILKKDLDYHVFNAFPIKQRGDSYATTSS